MSKRGEFRQFHVNFWQAPDVEDLDPIEKLLYIYMITSPKSNMEGVYKTTLRRIAFETGIDRDMIPKISARFEAAGVGGICQDGGTAWVVVSHAPDFLTSSPAIQKYYAENIDALPATVVEFMDDCGYHWPEWAEKPKFKRPSIGGGGTLPRPSIDPPQTTFRGWGDTVSDTDTDTDTDTKTSMRDESRESWVGDDFDESDPQSPVTASESKPPKPLPPLKDPTSRLWEDSLTAIQPPDTWANVGKERSAAKTLGKRTVNLVDQSPYESPQELVDAVIAEYRRLKQEARPSDTYWKRAPYTPSGVLAHWPQLWESLASRYEREEAQHEYAESMAGLF